MCGSCRPGSSSCGHFHAKMRGTRRTAESDRSKAALPRRAQCVRRSQRRAAAHLRCHCRAGRNHSQAARRARCTHQPYFVLLLFHSVQCCVHWRFLMWHFATKATNRRLAFWKWGGAPIQNSQRPRRPLSNFVSVTKPNILSVFFDERTAYWEPRSREQEERNGRPKRSRNPEQEKCRACAAELRDTGAACAPVRAKRLHPCATAGCGRVCERLASASGGAR